jgi:hypothetical protein
MGGVLECPLQTETRHLVLQISDATRQAELINEKDGCNGEIGGCQTDGLGQNPMRSLPCTQPPSSSHFLSTFQRFPMLKKLALLLPIFLCFLRVTSVTAKEKRLSAAIDVTSEKGSIAAANIAKLLALTVPLRDVFGNIPRNAFATLTIGQYKWLVALEGDATFDDLKPGHYQVETDAQHKHVWIKVQWMDGAAELQTREEKRDVLIILSPPLWSLFDPEGAVPPNNSAIEEHK